MEEEEVKEIETLPLFEEAKIKKPETEVDLLLKKAKIKKLEAGVEATREHMAILLLTLVNQIHYAEQPQPRYYDEVLHRRGSQDMV